MSVEYNTLVSKLLEAVPELAALKAPEIRVASDLPHVVFEGVLAPYLISLLENGKASATLVRIFDFLEELALDSDPRVREVVQVSVCERLGDRKETLARSRRYMGASTLVLSQEIEKQLERE